MRVVRWGDFPELDQLLGSPFDPEFDMEALDPVIRLDLHLGTCAEAERDLLWRQVQEFVALSPDEDSAETNLYSHLGHTGCPDGTSWREWLLVVRDRVQRAVEHPELMSRGSDYDFRPRRFRASKFTDKATANQACTLVLRAHEQEFRSWAQDQGGWWRQAYYADVGSPVGTVKDERSGFEGEVSGVVVVMKADHETGDVFIYDAYPEIPLDAASRERFPALTHLFGGFFGDVGDPPWLSQLNFQVCTRDPARSQVRGELSRLLELDDGSLRSTVEALGSHVLPDDMRKWLELMLWRIDAFDWLRRD